MLDTIYIKKQGDSEVSMNEVLPDILYLGSQFSPAINNNYQDMPVSDGNKFMISTFGSASLTARFFVRVKSVLELRMIRQEVYKFFYSRDLMRIRTSEDMSKVYHGRPNTFDLSPISDENLDMTFTLVFDIPSGFSETLNYSDKMDLNSMSFGMNLLSVEDKYTHTSKSFVINNVSDVAIDPYYQKHKLIIKVTANGTIELINKTNGTKWKYNGSLKSSDKIVLDGVVTRKNGVSDSKNTDFGFIKLDVGRNEFVVNGATTFSITFSFPFLYFA